MSDARRPRLGTCTALFARKMRGRFSGVCLAGGGLEGGLAFLCCRLVATQVLSGPQRLRYQT